MGSPAPKHTNQFWRIPVQGAWKRSCGDCLLYDSTSEGLSETLKPCVPTYIDV